MIEKTPVNKHLYERERGQSLVEMALGLIIVVTLFSGLVDLGRAYFALIAMEDAAGEAVMFLSAMPGCETPTSNPEPIADPDKCINTSNAIYRYQHAPGTQLDWAASSGRLGKSSIAICLETLKAGDFGCSTDTTTVQRKPTVGETYIVELRYSFQLLTPIITDLVGSDGIELKVKASQIVLFE